MPAGRRMGVTEQQRTAAFRQLADQRLDASYRLATAILGDASQSQDAVPSLDRARGTTFIGVYEGATPKEGGSMTSHWTVERAYAGPLHPGPLDGWGIGYGCHATGYREGTRYLVSSQFAGGGDAFDTVAYELLGDGRVRLAPFPEQPRRTAPRVYRQVHTLREALDLLVPSR